MLLASRLPCSNDPPNTRNNRFVDALKSYVFQGFKVERFLCRIMHYDGVVC